MTRHVVMIVIDCLRADHCGIAGYFRDTTPTLDRLAREGTHWTNAHSTSSWTKPSVGSLLTGLYPSQHGAVSGIKRSKTRDVAVSDVLQCPGQTLAEVFSDTNWRTGAFLNNAQLDRYTRFDRGFQDYFPGAGKADQIIGKFARWMAENCDRPTFSYLHFLETHWPYKPRRRHVAAFGGNRDTNRFSDYSARDYGKLGQGIARGEPLPPDALTEMVQLYDGAIRRVDGKLKLILGMLQELRVRDETAIIVTADHGEEFLEHGRIGHGHSLYQELLRVPLVASIPDGPGGTADHRPVSLVDLPKTVLRSAGIHAEFPGADLLSEDSTPSDVLAELHIKDRITRTLLMRQRKLHQTVRHDQVSGNCLYDLGDDPAEKVDEASRGRREVDEMSRNITKLVGQNTDRDDNSVCVEDQVMQRIRDLGYL